MAEKQHISHEHQPVLPKGPEITPKSHETVTYGEREQTEHIKRAQEAVSNEASRVEQPTVPDLPVTDDRPYLIDNATKMMRMRQNLSEVQKRLKPAQKRLSTVIHQPAVRRVSESAGKTVSRPSGLLGGGLLAFVGSLAYLYLTNTYSFTYNYLFFLVFFAGGFILGIAVEYSLYGIRRLAAR